jgi:hypothetical protein
VNHHVLSTWDELSPKERERAMGFQIDITSHTKVIRLECNALLGKGMDLNSLTRLLITYVLCQMYTTLALIQLAYNFGDAITWHLNQVHLPIFNTLHFILVLGGRLWGNFLSFYPRFYEVTIFESTCATNEGKKKWKNEKNPNVFLDVKLRS